MTEREFINTFPNIEDNYVENRVRNYEAGDCVKVFIYNISLNAKNTGFYSFSTPEEYVFLGYRKGKYSYRPFFATERKRGEGLNVTKQLIYDSKIFFSEEECLANFKIDLQNARILFEKAIKPFHDKIDKGLMYIADTEGKI